MIQAIVLVYAVLMLSVNLIVDLLFAVVDPRVSYG
jgi:ABC-type dipeptide/oligopeptide/nickel transport system permease component